jgi:hypothetical protein
MVVSSVAGCRGAVKHSFVLIFGMFDDQNFVRRLSLTFLVVKKLVRSDLCVQSPILSEVRVLLTTMID